VCYHEDVGVLTMFSPDQLDRDFTYWPPTEATAPRYAAIREAEQALHALFAMLRARGERWVAEFSIQREHPGGRLTVADCEEVNARTRAFAEVLDAQAPDGADKAAAYRCIRLARNAANEFIMACVTYQSPCADVLRIAADEIVKARWQACSAVALDGK
jgi:hypothetical protein